MDENADLSVRLRKAGVLLETESDAIRLQHQLRFNHPLFWGILFFLLGGLFIIYLSITKTDGLTELIVGTALGLLMFSFAAFALLTVYFDFVEITPDGIAFRINLKLQRLENNGNVKFRMKSEKMLIKGRNHTEIRKVSLYIVKDHVEITAFRFQMNELHGQEATALGNVLVQLLNSGINQYFGNTSGIQDKLHSKA